jgi:hypothetical protein
MDIKELAQMLGDEAICGGDAFDREDLHHMMTQANVTNVELRAETITYIKQMYNDESIPEDLNSLDEELDRWLN